MRQHTRGFTLIELLVAVAVFAIMAAIAYGALNGVIDQRSRNGEAMQRLRQLQLAMDIMCRDFEELAPRSVRDGLGGAVGPLVAGAENVPPLEFTRGGWSNPLGQARSTQERVAYTLEDGKLMRSFWPELDGSISGDPVKQELLGDVRAVHIQYADSSLSYQDSWPEVASGQQTETPQLTTHNNPSSANALNALAGSGVLPMAVSITISLKDWGDVTRIVEVAGP
jgi:general secretion pathway protein J